MVGKLRLKKVTLAVVNATRIAVAVPAGAIIEIPVAPLEGNRTVDVLWDGQCMMMFVQDLRERSEKIQNSRK